MIRAILDGSKTQTRRVVKPVRGYEHNNVCRPDHAADPDAVWWHGQFETVGCLQHCPYGAPGDRLWVRETWAAFTTPTYEYGEADLIEGPVSQEEAEVVYRADGQSMPERWRPSIFMPRWASRILLEITEVRVQRLQDISEDDARAEGITELPLQEGEPGAWWTAALDRRLHSRTPRGAFLRLWRSINGDGSWDANPWVWAITFRRLQP